MTKKEFKTLSKHDVVHIIAQNSEWTATVEKKYKEHATVQRESDSSIHNVHFSFMHKESREVLEKQLEHSGIDTGLFGTKTQKEKSPYIPVIGDTVWIKYACQLRPAKILRLNALKDTIDVMLDNGEALCIPWQELVDTNQDKTKDSSPTGGKKLSEGKLMMSELNWEFIEEMAKGMTISKEFYPPKNWQKPLDVEKLLEAAQRHMLELWKGNFTDSDGISHLAKVANNMAMIHYQKQNHEI